MEEDCVFCRIAAGQIPVEFIYRDDKVVAFRDIKPQAPVHVLIVPIEHIPTVNDIDLAGGQTAGRLVTAAAKIAKELGIDTAGYRFIINCNKNAGQEVFHLHAHLLGGRIFAWPPG